MTYREKIAELGKLTVAKLNAVHKIEEDQSHDGFHKYNIFDYQQALDELTHAANSHGKLVNDMVKKNLSPNDDYHK